MHGRYKSARVGLVGGGALCLLAGGCGWMGWGKDDKAGGERLEAAGFRLLSGAKDATGDPAPAKVDTTTPPSTPDAPRATATPVTVTPPVTPVTRDEDLKVRVAVEPAPVPEPQATSAGRDVLADCMVGQINGKPVFASEILDPLDGQLRQLAAKSAGPSGLRDWAQAGSGLIMKSLRDRVRDELLLGEARTRLSPEQRQGLIYFLERLDSYLSGQTGGSREQAAQRIEDQTGSDYDKFLQDFRDKQLIRELVDQNVTPNVRVPWRKVERFYSENLDLFNPPAKGVVRIVVIDGSDPAAVKRATEAVEKRDGQAFAELAGSVANKDAELRAAKGRIERPLDGAGGFGAIKWVGNERWNQAAAGLSEGGFSTPIEGGGFKVWVHREADIPAKTTNLEEAQLQVLAGLKAAKQQEEESAFLNRLLGKSSLTPVNSMLIELLVLAGQRHLTPELSGRLRDVAPTVAPVKPELERSPAPLAPADVPVPTK